MKPSPIEQIVEVQSEFIGYSGGILCLTVLEQSIANAMGEVQCTSKRKGPRTAGG